MSRSRSTPDRKSVATVVTLLGVLLAAVGAGLVYLPAGLIVGGVCLGLFGLLAIDV